jgi:uncharacterized membrane protein YbhN (UPF0104 family)
MIKNILYALSMIVGVFLLLCFFIAFLMNLEELSSPQSPGYKFGIVIFLLIFLAVGIFFFWFGLKKLNPKKKKKRESIEDIGAG